MSITKAEAEEIMLTCRVPREDAEKLDRVAEERGTTRSDLIRKAIARLVNKVA